MLNARTLRYAALAASFLLITAVAYAYWRRGDNGDEELYVTDKVDRGPIVATVTATGTLNPVTIVQVGTYVSGTIVALDVDFNSKVKKRQRVAKIDPAPFRVKVQQAEANAANAQAHLDKDEADLELKKVTLSRVQKLLAKDLISRNDVDTAKSNYDQAVAQIALDKAAIAQANGQLEETRINLAYTDITSPVDGVVVSRNVNVGQTVAASFQTPTLFLISEDLTQMQVDTNVSESDIGWIQLEQPATFTVDAYPSKEFNGTVSQIRKAPITVQNVVTYDVVIAADNSSMKLMPGMTATVSVLTAKRENALRLPVRALRFHPQPGTASLTAASERVRHSQKVWVIKSDGTASKVSVKIGVQDDRFAEVLSGDLHDGERVAIANRVQAPGTSQAVATSQGPPPSFAGMRH